MRQGSTSVRTFGSLREVACATGALPWWRARSKHIFESTWSCHVPLSSRGRLQTTQTAHLRQQCLATRGSLQVAPCVLAPVCHDALSLDMRLQPAGRRKRSDQCYMPPRKQEPQPGGGRPAGGSGRGWPEGGGRAARRAKPARSRKEFKTLPAFGSGANSLHDLGPNCLHNLVFLRKTLIPRRSCKEFGSDPKARRVLNSLRDLALSTPPAPPQVPTTGTTLERPPLPGTAASQAPNQPRTCWRRCLPASLQNDPTMSNGGTLMCRRWPCIETETEQWPPRAASATQAPGMATCVAGHGGAGRRRTPAGCDSVGVAT